MKKQRKRFSFLLTFSTLHLVTLSFLLGAAPSSLPTTQPIPHETLNQIYQRELGTLYNAADAEKYAQASELLDRYFADPQARPEITKLLEALSLDPNLIGRLAHSSELARSSAGRLLHQ